MKYFLVFTLLGLSACAGRQKPLLVFPSKEQTEILDLTQENERLKHEYELLQAKDEAEMNALMEKCVKVIDAYNAHQKTCLCRKHTKKEIKK